MKYRIGTRKSRLSLVQTEQVVLELQAANADAEFEIVKITTKGDTDSRPFFAIDQKGIFEKEIDNAVASGEIDFAVHSMKDVPTDLASGLVLACVPKREDVNDVIVSSDGVKLGDIKSGSVIGTSSLRRAVQVSRKRSDLEVKPVRGNIDTRIEKIGNEYDAVILAQAGITRLNIDAKYKPLSLSDFLPSPGQGALAIVARAEEKETISMLNKIESFDAKAEALAERALSASIESGCQFPVGAIAGVDAGIISINAVAYSVDGKEAIYAEQSGPVSEAAKIGYMAGKELTDGGVGKLASSWREKLAEWNKDG